ncbi:MAG: adenine deaminase [Bacteroidales bacterium]|nr:adenine deaminase [Bacteroidales bacterium]
MTIFAVRNNPSMKNDNTFSLSGQIIDLVHSRIFPGRITVNDSKITEIEELPVAEQRYIMPGFIDAHIHIESSMVPPSEFARMAVCHGTVATVSDPHEIANVMGVEGIDYMIRSGKRGHFKFYFGAPSCVPATPFETSGFTLDAQAIEALMTRDDIYYLSEMMNYPGVLSDDSDILKKLEAAKRHGKPIDGHAPMVTGDDIKKYIASGISTDHECYAIEDALEKVHLGMKILIREGSAAKNFDVLIPLMAQYPEQLMFCSDDKHPNDLIKGHINLLVKRALQKGYKLMDVLRAASLNAVRHYHLDVGMLQTGDDADFIVVDNPTDLNVLQTYVKGRLVAENGVSLMPRRKEEACNNFHATTITPEDLQVPDEGKRIKVIACMDGNLITNTIIATPKVVEGNLVSDTSRDILKMVVLNRYTPAKPAIGFINNIGLKRGAIATSVSNDSHNIVAVGCSDEDIARAINLLVYTKGGMVACSETEFALLPLPIAGLMSLEEGSRVAEDYERADKLAHEFGCTLYSPFMTLSFMALLVIPELKLSDKGLFDVTQFSFTSLTA